MKAVNLVLALLVSALMGLLVFEGGLRLIGKGPPASLNAFDPDTGWTNKPGARITNATPDGASVDFAFNQYGLREADDVVPARAAGVLRVVALGDSFTLGRTLPQQDLFLDRMEAAWNEAGHDVQVINTGREGWSTDQEVAWLLAHGDEWKPDVVVLLPYDNDIYWCGQRRYTGLDKPRFGPDGKLEGDALEDHMDRGLLRGSAIGRMASRVSARLFGDKDGAPHFRPGTKDITAEFGIVLDELPGFMQDPMARAEGALKALVSKCDQLGAELVVVPIPSEAGIHEAEREKLEEKLGLKGVGWSADNAFERFVATARAAGVPAQRILDVRPRFRERDAADEVLYFEKDWHLNPAGNAQLALFLIEELGGLGLTPVIGDASLPALPASSGELPGWLPWFLGLWLLVGGGYARVYRKEENPALGFLKVGAMLSVIFTLAVGGSLLIVRIPPTWAPFVLIVIILAILGFVAFKLGDRLGTIVELLTAFIRRGHWYLMPLVTVLLTVGSLLVVAASSPLVAPFIYTLF